MIFVLLLVFMPAAGWWSFRFQRRAVAVAHRGAGLSPMAAPAPAPPAVTGTSGAHGQPAVVAVQQLERPVFQGCTSVLGWDAFTLAATLVMEGTMLLSCRRVPAGAVSGSADELTVVLHIGEDERAARAVALFQAWQTVGTTLRVRPTTVVGAIEILDDRQRVIRAPLLVA